MVKARDIRSRGRVVRPSVGRTPTPFLDRDLTYYRDGNRWTFAGGKILLDGYDVNRLISEPNAEIGTWLGIASGLDDYRKKITAAARDRDQYTRFESVIEALLGKIFGRLKRAYDEKRSGLSWSIENGQLILNGINIRAFLARYRLNKNEKARKFLEGMRSKLLLLLDNPDHEKIRGTVQDLYQELGEELGSASPVRPARPLPARNPLDR